MNFAKNIVIIGLGVLGSSIAMSLKKKGFSGTIKAYDTDEETIEYALKNNIIDEFWDYTSLSEQKLLAIDLIVISVPVMQIEFILLEILRIKEKYKISSLTITDVGSTKNRICQSAWNQKGGEAFIGSHPMAGKERAGIWHGLDYLYEKATIFICSKPMPNQAETEFVTMVNSHKEKIISLWELMGGVIFEVDGDYHDEIVAYTSHLPHLLSMSLMSYLGRHQRLKQPLFQEQRKWFGGGLIDFTRIAASSPDMWVEIFLQNKDSILDSLTGYTKELEEFANLIKENKQQELYAYLKNSAYLRDCMVPPNAKLFTNHKDKK